MQSTFSNVQNNHGFVGSALLAEYIEPGVWTREALRLDVPRVLQY